MSAHGTDAVVRLDVVGAKHEVAELAHELLAFLQRAVDHPARLAAYRCPLGESLLDTRPQANQALLRRQDVVKRVSELVVAHLLQQHPFVGLDECCPGVLQLSCEARDFPYQDVPLPDEGLDSERMLVLSGSGA